MKAQFSRMELEHADNYLVDISSVKDFGIPSEVDVISSHFTARETEAKIVLKISSQLQS